MHSLHQIWPCMYSTVRTLAPSPCVPAQVGSPSLGGSGLASMVLLHFKDKSGCCLQEVDRVFIFEVGVVC